MSGTSSDAAIVALHAAIVTAVENRFATFKQVQFHQGERPDPLQLPACLLQMRRFEVSQKLSNGGNGQVPCVLDFSARIVVDEQLADAALNLRANAVELAVWLQQLGRFPAVASEPIQVGIAEPEQWPAAGSGVLTWRVDWSVPLLLGKKDWNDNGQTPNKVFYAISPEIGIPHETGYQALEADLP